MKKLILALFIAILPTSLLASEKLDLKPANVNLRDKTAMQRGAGYFVNYCQGCHSLKFLRVNRLAKDLSIPEDIAIEELLIGTDKIGEPMLSNIPVDQSKEWFGITPPDLSLTARLRGEDWIYNYLISFYKDPSAPSGWNNTVFENAAMPHVMSNLQGVQELDHETHELKLVSKGSRTDEYDQIAHDITAFLAYAAEPIKAKRQEYGIYVMLFLLLFFVLAYALKKEYWRDVH
jgi:ubiquinol-cytochrome c reductase cytochrome c1 subunit